MPRANNRRTRRLLVIPKESPKRFAYIPIAFLDPDVIASDELLTVSGATNFHFGVLTSKMHMSWAAELCEGSESVLSYSADKCYNNFPWPENPTDKQKTAVEAKAQAVLDARAAFPDSSLADLYDPLIMPESLAKAHAELDRAVELCYRANPFENDRERVEYLFELYERLTAPLAAGADQPKRRKRKDEA